ncbi:IS3 family transposase [Roseivirga sp. BDSF3-8]|uniref:IS3 family transposase n=1 Tax=Roseivirga sp. BDSF3-8 TaxID=3241598 RepID=UPI003531DBA6
MKRLRRHFDKEFKQMAVELCDADKTAKEVAEELGIRSELVRRWCREFKQHGESSFSGQGNPTLSEDEKEIVRLKKELRDAQLERDNLKKGHKHFLQGRQQVYRFIKAFKAEYAVEKMCNVFQVSRSGYYAWCNRKPSNRAKARKGLQQEIRQIYTEVKGRYGSPKICAELQRNGRKASRPFVARLMRAERLKCIRSKKYRGYTTDSDHHYSIPDNHLNRDFTAARPAEKWVSDITYIWAGTKWLYLTTIIDLYDRKVIGWSLSTTLSVSETVMKAWQMAIKNRPIEKELIFHSDRGIQYASEAFTYELRKRSVIQSMSRKANCWDNAVAESFFRTLKSEMVYHTHFNNIMQAKRAVFEFIEVWYNRKRLHAALEYKTPEEYGNTNLPICA